MAPSPAAPSTPTNPNGQRTPSIFKHRERSLIQRLATPSPSLPPPSASSDHPVEVIGRIRDHPEGSERPSVLQVIHDGQMVRVRTEQGYRDFGLDGVSLAEKEDLQGFYKKYVESRIETVKMGGRCTIMMYGPTGAGKSYTMFGSATEPGIAYRALEKILGHFSEDPQMLDAKLGHGCPDSSAKTIRVNVSILEIYNEETFDLLATCSNTSNGHWTKPGRVRLEIMGKKVKNAVSISGSDAEKISREIAKVEKRRVVKSTSCNDTSSRSHCLVMIDVPALGGRLVLVDMAGSENLEQAGLGTESKLQTGKINQGNIALKRVVEAIANGDSYIPFRDSKLTMLLQDSFEDDGTKILMILCASPDPKDMHKTIGTLEYGSKAKCIVRLPPSPEKGKALCLDRKDFSALEGRIRAMDIHIDKLEAENLNKDREREEINQELMQKEQELLVLSKVLEQMEQDHIEKCNRVHNDDYRIEMEKKLEECQRIADELMELGKESLEKKVVEQQKEIDLMRSRMEEIEREVQLLLKGNLQPCFSEASFASKADNDFRYKIREVPKNRRIPSEEDEESTRMEVSSMVLRKGEQKCERTFLETRENGSGIFHQPLPCGVSFEFSDALPVHKAGGSLSENMTFRKFESQSCISDDALTVQSAVGVSEASKNLETLPIRNLNEQAASSSGFDGTATKYSVVSHELSKPSDLPPCEAIESLDSHVYIGCIKDELVSLENEMCERLPVIPEEHEEPCEAIESLDSHVYIGCIKDELVSLENEMCERLPVIPEEPEGEEGVTEDEAHHDVQADSFVLKLRNHTESLDNGLARRLQLDTHEEQSEEAPIEVAKDAHSQEVISESLSSTERNKSADICTGYEGATVTLERTDDEGTQGLASAASRRSRIENIFMLCGNHRELTAVHTHELINEPVQSGCHHTSADLNQVPVDPFSACLPSRFSLANSIEEPSNGLATSSPARALKVPPITRREHVSPKANRHAEISPVHITPVKPKQSSSENTPPREMSPHLASPTSTASIIQNFKSPRKLSFDGFSPNFTTMKGNQQDSEQDVDMCEVYVKWETSRDSSGKLIKLIYMKRNATLAELRRELEEHVLEAEHDFSFLMLGDPSGAPIERDNEVKLPVASLPDCHKQRGSKLACLRPHLRRVGTVRPLSSVENQISQSSLILAPKPLDVSFSHLKFTEGALTSHSTEKSLNSHSTDKAKTKQRLSFPMSSHVKGIRL